MYAVSLKKVMDVQSFSTLIDLHCCSEMQGYKNCVLTPNVAELGRLAKGVGVQLEGPISTAWQEAAAQV